MLQVMLSCSKGSCQAGLWPQGRAELTQGWLQLMTLPRTRHRECHSLGAAVGRAEGEVLSPQPCSLLSSWKDSQERLSLGWRTKQAATLAASHPEGFLQEREPGGGNWNKRVMFHCRGALGLPTASGEMPGERKHCPGDAEGFQVLKMGLERFLRCGVWGREERMFN